jgi:hypothetical protein
MTMRMMATSGGAAGKTYVDDVFSAYTYTGNGSSQTINNGIDLAGKGGMVWTKSRSLTFPNYIVDTVRGASINLISNSAAAQSADGYYSGFNANGYGINGVGGLNSNSATYVGWTFRRAPKFFDVVTYTGNGGNLDVNHSLGISPGMMLVKAISGANDWTVFHKNLAASQNLFLNKGDAVYGLGNPWGGLKPTSTFFRVGDPTLTNANGVQYVAYLFAHDTAADGLIQCGSFIDGSSSGLVTLGWEPQFVMFKRRDSVSDWFMMDTSRNMPAGAVSTAKLYANTSGTELDNANGVYPTATGFGFYGVAGDTYIYMAIRRPNKPPTSGTQVYNAIARTGTGAAVNVTGVGFPPDMLLSANRDGYLGRGYGVFDKLRGPKEFLQPSTTNAGLSDSTGLMEFLPDGVKFGIDNLNGCVNAGGGTKQITHCFKRAPGFFDEVCWTGSGVARTVAHSLGAVPELIIAKARSAAESWPVFYNMAPGAPNRGYLNQGSAMGTTGYSPTAELSAQPTAAGILLGSSATMNTSGNTYVAYLFATLPGISKVGSYVGNGSSQVIPCGFSNGARFILVKRADAAGGWMLFDSVRGITASFDPFLTLNTSAAEVTYYNVIIPNSSGFGVQFDPQGQGNPLNYNLANYIFLAIA